MSWILLAVVVIVVAVLLAALMGKQTGGAGSIGFPYQPAKTLFSAAERSYLGVLDQALGADYRVFGKVRVADVALVKPRMTKSARQGALNRVAAKHFDFVVCNSSDLVVRCAIELNDKSHASQRAQARDDLLVNVCKAIGLPLLQVAAKQGYTPQEVRDQVLAAISPAPVIARG